MTVLLIALVFALAVAMGLCMYLFDELERLREEYEDYEVNGR